MKLNRMKRNFGNKFRILAGIPSGIAELLTNIHQVSFLQYTYKAKKKWKEQCNLYLKAINMVNGARKQIRKKH